MQWMKLKLIGKRPLLMHNIRLANPMDKMTRALSEITQKRKKTLADHELIAAREYEAGIYHDAGIGPYIPAAQVDKMIEEGGRGEKLGKSIRATVRCMEQQIPLLYEGKRDMKWLWDNKFYDQRAIGVGGSRTIRTRPKFEEWSIEPTIYFEETIVNPSALIRALERAGSLVGLGDYRPRFGLFSVRQLDGGAVAETQLAEMGA